MLRLTLLTSWWWCSASETLLGRGAAGSVFLTCRSLAGLERPSYYRMNLIARALRHLGWRRTRCRFGGTLAYGYSRGTRLQREDILEIERREDGQVTLKEVP